MLAKAILVLGVTQLAGVNAILGGYNCATNEWNYVGYFHNGNNQVQCSGTLIANNVVLTTKQCAAAMANGKFTVGVSDRSSSSGCTADVDTWSFYEGLACVKTKTKLTCGTPIQLSWTNLGSTKYPDLIGWGDSVASGGTPNRLQCTTLKYATAQTTCKSSLGSCGNTVTNKHMCLERTASINQGGYYGDAGAAIIYNGKLKGIMSHMSCSSNIIYTGGMKINKMLDGLLTNCGCLMARLGTLQSATSESDDPGSGDSDTESITASCPAGQKTICMKCKKLTANSAFCAGNHDGSGNSTLSGQACSSDNVQNTAFTCDTATKTATCDHTKMTGGCDCCDYKIRGLFCYAQP